MTTAHPNGRADPDAAAARLSAAWDALVAGRPAEADDEGLVTVAHHLHATTDATDARERPGFRQDLRDMLVQSPTIAIPTPGSLSGHRIVTAPSDQIAVSTATMLRRTGGRWLSLAATLALLLMTAVGGYLASVGTDGDRRLPGVATLEDQSPITTSVVEPFPCGPTGTQEFNPYLACASGPVTIGSTEVRGLFSSGDRDVSAVQMQSWRVYVGGSVTFGRPSGRVLGIGVDVVLDGAYVATFTRDVSVSAAVQVDTSVGYGSVPAGEEVELVAGDTVSYAIGTKIDIVNPLNSRPLTFKSILVYEGDPTPRNQIASGDYEVSVDGDGKLPMPIGAYGPLGPYILLNYVTIVDGYPFPPADQALDVVLGPVAGFENRDPQEGFVLWAAREPGVG